MKFRFCRRILDISGQELLKQLRTRKPISRCAQLPIIRVMAFSQTNFFLD